MFTSAPSFLRDCVRGTVIHLPVVVSLSLSQLAIAASTPSAPAPSVERNARNYGSLPLSFERNQGQADTHVRYLSHGRGYTILFKDHEADLVLGKGHTAGHAPLQPGSSDPRHAETVEPIVDSVRMRVVGPAGTPALTGEDRLTGTVNYFLGSNPTKWHTGVATFERVRYRGVYPGVDLVYYGNPHRLEFDFELASGAHANAIQIHFDGARKLKLDRDGNLVVVAGNGSVSFRKPVIYQQDGEGRKIPVDGSFHIVSDKTVGFRIGHYDRKKPIVIDPILDYSTYLGDSGGANAIAVNSAGEAYVAGWADTGMPTTTGAIEPTPESKTDISAFVAKFNSTGTALIYCTYLSGNGADEANGIAVDNAGNAYVAGTTSSTDFPTTTGAFQTANKAANGGSFIAKINSTGTALAYSTYLSGSTSSQITGIAVDSSGDAYVTGDTSDSDFPTTSGAFQSANKATAAGAKTGFISKMNGTGSALVYSTYLGGSTLDASAAIALDSAGDAYVTGTTESTDFPTTPNAYQLSNNTKSVSGVSQGTTFVTKMNLSGTGLVYSTYLGGSLSDIAYAIALDTSDDAYVTGFTLSSDFPSTPGVIQPSLQTESQNAYVTKLNTSGTALVYSTFLGGGPYGYDQTAGIAIDSAGNATLVGRTADSNFPITAGALQIQNTSMIASGGTTVSSFVTRINSTATALLYSTYLSGSGDGNFDYEGICDCANGVALDSGGNVYLAGLNWSSDFPTTLGAFQQTSSGTFVTEFNASEMTALPATTTALTANVNPQVPGQPVTFTATIQPNSGKTPTGTVAFSFLTGDYPWEMSSWSTVSLNAAGAATYTISSLLSGHRTVNAYYLGDTNNAPSSASMTETISQLSTVTTVVSSANPAPYGSAVNFTATVLDSSGNPAKGFVDFQVGNLDYGIADLDSAGQSVWTNGQGGPPLPVGTSTITVRFTGYVGYQNSSGSVTETFTALGVTPAPTFSPAAGTYTSEQFVTLNGQGSIYYTTDGSTPVVGNGNILVAGELIDVDSSQTINAIAVAPGYTTSTVASAVYVINLTPGNFTVSIVPSSVTVLSSASTSTTININPSGGFNGKVTLACSGLPAGVTASFSPVTITPGNSSVMTVNASASAYNMHPWRMPFLQVTSLAICFVWIGTRRRRPGWILLLIAAGAVGLFSLTACGGGSSQPPPPMPTTSTVTVTATSGSLSNSTTLILTVN
jgi:hypothetical protein